VTRACKALLALAFASCFAFARAGDYPSRPVHLVVPYPPGGSSDIQARIIAPELERELGKPVVIENKPGAAATIGAAYVAHAAPDGYTIYLASPSHAISASMYTRLPYDPVRSFAPISLVAVSPFVLTVYAEEDIHSVPELIALERAKPDEVTFASSGAGAGPHLITELMDMKAGVHATHVPYQGGAPAIRALLAKEVNFMFADISVLPLIKTGKLRALAVTTASRMAQLPGVPTLEEAGLHGIVIDNWTAILAPAGTPAAVIAKLNAAIAKALADPKVRSQFQEEGFEPVASSPQELESQIVSDIERYAKAIKVSGARVD
jgi:tripartite-type tricarboxylate transporter receptor subunit TctC